MPWEFMQINYSVVVLEKIFPTYSNVKLDPLLQPQPKFLGMDS